MAAHKMPKDVEARIRALPGNNTCVDCKSLTPQWASVSYGTLMCLECSGHHRSLGVHLSFVRSVQMDSWKDREVEAMETSGGNAAFCQYMESRKIAKEWPIVTKYNSKQAAYYKERLERRLNGRTEPPPDPGCWDPVSGGDALGAEPLPGETADQYNARQERLRTAARERMAAKFGGGGGSFGGGMSGLGCEAPEDRSIGSVVSGVGSFLKSKTLDNDELKDALGGGVAGVAGFAGSLWGKARQGVASKLGREAPSPGVGRMQQTMSDSDSVCWNAPPLGERTLSSTRPRDDDWESLFNKTPAQPHRGSPSTTASEDEELPVRSFKVSAPAKPGAPTKTTSAPVAPVVQAAPPPSAPALQRKVSAPAPAREPLKKEPAKKLASSDDFFAEFGL